MIVDHRRPNGVGFALRILALFAIAAVMSSCVIPIPVTYSVSWLESVDLDNNPDAEDPTWNKLKAFLANDKTDERTYSGEFVCADFARTLHDNAEEAGIRAAVVAVDFEDDDTGHALNAFDTIDQGLLYIDVTAPISNFPCSSDKTVVMEIGKVYTPESIFSCPGYYSTWGSLGKIKDFEIRW